MFRSPRGVPALLRGLFQPERVFDAVKDVSFQVLAGQTWPWSANRAAAKPRPVELLFSCYARAAVNQSGRQAWLDTASGPSGTVPVKWRRFVDRATPVQMIFQDPFASLNPRMRVSDINFKGLLTLRLTGRLDQRDSKVRQLIEQVGLRADALARFPPRIFGGQRQRRPLLIIGCGASGAGCVMSRPRRWTCLCRRKS